MSHELNQFLFDSYGGFADKRLKRVLFDRALRVDHHQEDVNQNIHCLIFARVQPEERLILGFSGNVPWDADVESAAHRFDTPTSEVTGPAHIQFDLDERNIRRLRSLATAFRNVTRPGTRYETPSWKYSSKETANALDDFADRLVEYLRLRG